MTRGAIGSKFESGVVCSHVGGPTRCDERVDESGVNRGRRLATQQRGGTQHRVHRAQIAGLPVEDAGQSIARLRLGRIGVPLDEGLGGEDHRRRGVARLDGTRLDKRLLDGMQPPRRVEALDRLDLVPVCLSCEHDLGRDQTPVQQYGVGTGLTRLGAKTHAEETFPAEDLTQRLVRLEIDGSSLAVDGDGRLHDAPPSRVTTLPVRTRASSVRYSLLPRKSAGGWSESRWSGSTRTGVAATPVRATRSSPDGVSRAAADTMAASAGVRPVRSAAVSPPICTETDVMTEPSNSDRSASIAATSSLLVTTVERHLRIVHQQRREQLALRV